MCNGPSFFISLTKLSFDLFRKDFKNCLLASDAIVSSAPMVAISAILLNKIYFRILAFQIFFVFCLHSNKSFDFSVKFISLFLFFVLSLNRIFDYDLVNEKKV